MFVNKLKMDKVAEAVKKCMDEDELEETGLRKAAYAAHNKGEKMFSFKGKTYPVKVQGEEVSYGEEMKESSCDDEVKKHEKRLHGKDGEVSKHVNKMHKEELEELDEKNVPNSPEKWAQAKSQAKAKFDVYPSAYANGWASKKYKSMGGTWRTESIEQIDELSDKQKKIARLADPKDKIDAGDLAKLRGEKTVSEAEKVITPTGMKVYGSSYGNSEKARKDQLKGTVDVIKNPTKSDLDKPMKEGFFKDRLITNYIEEESAFEEALQEVLSKDASAGDYISDFVHSDNPKFAGKSVKKRQKMALAAYYAKKNESVDDSYSVTTDTVAGRMPGGMSNTFKQFKVKLSAKDKEAAETLNQIHNSNPMHMAARDPHIGNGGFVSIPPAGVVHKEEVDDLGEENRYRATYHDPDTGKVTHMMDFKHKTLESAKKHASVNRLQRRDGKDDVLHSVVQQKEEVEQMEESAPKKMDDVAKQDLSPTKKSVTGQVKSDIKNFGRFLAGKKETMESVTNVPFDGPYTKDKPVKNSDGSIQSPMSRARELAKQAMKRVKSNVQGKPSKKD